MSAKSVTISFPTYREMSEFVDAFIKNKGWVEFREARPYPAKIYAAWPANNVILTAEGEFADFYIQHWVKYAQKLGGKVVD